MKKNLLLSTVLSALLMFAFIPVFSQNMWINEIHYDNLSGDVNEGFEVAVDATILDLANIRVTLYNGGSGASYGTHTLDAASVGSTTNGIVFYTISLPVNGLQNGSPDGLSLDYSGTLIMFISYEGTFTAADGVATGILSTDIGISESGTGPVGNSLQLAGTGATYSDFEWILDTTSTFSSVNIGQTIGVAIPSGKANILSFTLPEQTTSALIDTTNATVDIEVFMGISLTGLIPTFTLSSGATASPASGVAHNFTDGVPEVYVVTAQNGVTIKNWNITVSVSTQPLTSIYDIQYAPTDSGYSALNGQSVITQGAVTSLHYSSMGGTYRGYFIQDGYGPWNGIYVYDAAHTPTVGDQITLAGTVFEYSSASDDLSVTELTSITGYTTNSSGNTLPTPTLIATEVMGEAYEGVIIHLENVICSSIPDAFNVWKVKNTLDLNVDDDVYAYTPTISSVYNITGIGHYSFNAYKIIPRSALDIELATGTPEVIIGDQDGISVYPNPVSNDATLIFNCDNSKEHSLVFRDITGRTVSVSEKFFGNSTVFRRDYLPSGYYFVEITGMDNPVVISVVVE